jgi:hypothetical protein
MDMSDTKGNGPSLSEITQQLIGEVREASREVLGAVATTAVIAASNVALSLDNEELGQKVADAKDRAEIAITTAALTLAAKYGNGLFAPKSPDQPNSPVDTLINAGVDILGRRIAPFFKK